MKQRRKKEEAANTAATADGNSSPRRGGQPLTDERGGGGGGGQGPAGAGDQMTCAEARDLLTRSQPMSCHRRAALAAHGQECGSCFLLAVDQFIAELSDDLRAHAEGTKET